MRTLFDDRLSMSADLHMDDPSTAEKGSNIRGTSGGDDLYGGNGDDTIRGLGGDDYISGGNGDDLLFGGSGSDNVYDSSSGSDTLFGDSGDDYLYVSRNYAQTSDGTEHISMDGGDGADNLTIEAYSYYLDDYPVEATLSGGAGDDVINIYAAQHATVLGGSGADTVNATVGSDLTVSLGGGADVLHLDGVSDGPAILITDFAVGDDGDTVQLRDLISSHAQDWDHENPFGEGYLRLIQDGADTLLQFDAAGGGDTWTDLVRFKDVAKGDLTAFNLDGFPSDGSDAPGELITGTDSSDDLYGTAGADTINGLGSYDWIYGGDGSDLIDGGDGGDYIDGGYGSDTLIGGAGDDRIDARGADKAYGGVGDDSIYAVFYDAEKGVAKLDGGAGDDNITVQFSSTGKVGAVVTGGGGNDEIDLFGVGRYVVNAGSGDDHLFLENVGDEVKLTLGGGADRVTLSSYYDAPSHTVITDFQAGPGGDQLDLLDFMNTKFVGWDHSTNPFAAGYLRLVVQDGAATLQWSAAADETWSDLFVLKGVNTAELTAENLSGYPGDGSAPDGLLITGGSGYDYLEGGIGPDTIIGGGGGDDIVGGAGDDSLLGGAGNDYVDGGFGSDYVNGGAGDDILSGGDGGNDTLVGGKGDDQLYANSSSRSVASAVVISGGGGDDQIDVYDSYHQLTVVASAGSGNDGITLFGVEHSTITAGGGADYIYVESGGSRIDAGAGDDTLSFRGLVEVRVTLGDGKDFLDLYHAYSASTFEVTDFGAGDTIGLSDFASWNFGSNDPFAEGIFRLVQHGRDTILQANEPYDSSTAWTNLLTLDKVDATSLSAKQLDGYHHGPIWLVGDDGRDKLTSDADFNHLDGGGGKDVLTGAAGGDVLIGGLGGDQLSGGTGADVFMYVDVRDSLVSDHDVITDLSDSDTINLSQIDANAQWYGDQAFVLVDKFDGQAGELMLHYRASSDTTLLSGDTDGDGRADFEVLIKGDHADFVNFVL